VLQDSKHSGFDSSHYTQCLHGMERYFAQAEKESHYLLSLSDVPYFDGNLVHQADRLQF
jgi:hypothetical protein